MGSTVSILMHKLEIFNKHTQITSKRKKTEKYRDCILLYKEVCYTTFKFRHFSILSHNSYPLQGAKLLQFGGTSTPLRSSSEEQQLQHKSALSTTAEVCSYA